MPDVSALPALRVPLTADERGLKRGLDAARLSVSGFARDASGAGSVAAAGLDNAGRSANQMARDVVRNAGLMEASNDNVARSAARIGPSYLTALGPIKAVAGAAAALGALFTAGAGVRAFITNTIEADQAQSQLAARIRSTGGVAGQTIESLNETAAALQSVTTYGDDAVNGMQGLLLTFTKIGGDVFPRATEAVLDVATAMGTDLRSSALQIGKALNDPVRGLDGLSRAGIQFSAAQKAMIKDMAEAGNVAGAQGAILNELEGQMGGAARAARDDLGGAFKSLANVFGDLFELGGTATEPLRRGIEGLISALQDPRFMEFAELIGTVIFASFTAAVQAATLFANGISLAVGWLNDLGIGVEGAGLLLAAYFGPAILTSIAGGLTAMGAAGVAALRAIAVAMASNPLGLIAVVVAGIITAMYQWRDSFQPIADAFAWIEEKAQIVFDVIRKAAEGLGFLEPGTLEVKINADDAANKLRGGLRGGAEEAAPGLRDGVAEGGNRAAAAIGSSMASAANQAQAIYEHLNGRVIKPLGDALTNGGDYIYNQVTGAVERAGETIGTAVADAGGTAGAGLAGRIENAGAVTGRTMYDALISGGNVMTNTFVNGFQQSAAQVIGNMLIAQIGLVNAQARLANAQALLAQSQAALANRQALEPGKFFGGGGGDGSSGIGRGSSGGRMSSSGLLLDRENRSGTGSTVDQGGAASTTAPAQETSRTTEGPRVDLQVVNVWDPDDMVNVMGTQAGRKALINFAKANREELQAILGLG